MPRHPEEGGEVEQAREKRRSTYMGKQMVNMAVAAMAAPGPAKPRHVGHHSTPEQHITP
jgi:hypothetical protein